MNKKITSMMISSTLLLGGCAATQTAIQHRNLEVATTPSDTVFLDPVADAQKTVILQIRNTSDRPNFELSSKIAENLRAKGYKIVTNPEKAHYLLQANVLKVSKATPEQARNFLASGYGGAISGGAVGAGIGAISGRRDATFAGGLIGAAIGTVADAMVENTTFTVVTDLQISERTANDVYVNEQNTAKLHQGNSGYKHVTSNEKTHWKRYQTRIVSSANQVNLKLNDAEPELIAGLSRSISGMFS